MYWKTFVLVFTALVGGFCSSQAQTPAPKRSLTFEDLMAVRRVGQAVPSPDGKWVVFDAVDVDLGENTKRTHLWIVPSAGGDARRLNPGSNNDESRPRFSPDGRRVLFTSKAGDAPQIWVGNLDVNSGALTGTPHALTAISTGADGAIWSPDGRNVLFVSEVYPEAGDAAANRERDDALKKSKVKAQIFTRLLFRHWNAFTQFKRSHLFVVGADADPAHPDNPSTDATLRDLTPGDHDVPPFSLGGQDAYAISPDGRELAYTSNVDEVEATSTNNDIFLVPIGGGTPKKISTSPGSDSTPVYSPDGKWLAWRSQARAGYESDKQSLIIYDRQSGQLRDATPTFDRGVDSIAWSPDSTAVFFTAEDGGESPIYALPVQAAANIQPTEIARLHAGDLAFEPDGKRLFFSCTTISMPSEIESVDTSDWQTAKENGTHVSTVTRVTHANDAVLAQVTMNPLESFHFSGAEGATVEGFLLKPPGFDPSKKYPVKFLIHGGPQGAWGDSWSFRWNPELFAAAGNYVVVMINPHGSTGYGQAFTDGVNGDWGGKPYVDLMKGLDYVEQTYPFIDKNREAALGASYGGYMINWILGHTDRFKCLVSHDGLFNAVAAYGATEELWFNEWEYRGTPWDNPETYQRWSPDQFAKNFKTPTLVVHGQLDYRLDVSQGFALFTTLQRLHVPSKMLYFPDEGHWVLKPQNSQLWNQTVNGWVDQWTGAGPR